MSQRVLCEMMVVIAAATPFSMAGVGLAEAAALIAMKPAPLHYWACTHQKATEDESKPEQRTATITIPVKILADVREPTTRKKWEERLRKRLDSASQILEKTCGVRFETVAVETWDPDPTITGMQESLREFGQKVIPVPGELAIGFTSKLRVGPSCHWLGVTGGVLHSHVLVREWYGAETEVERLEVLVHELGHYLGAAHSAASDSVMRPRLGDGRARWRKFQIGFDPLNARAMNLIADSMRRHGFRALVVLEPQRRSELQAVYENLLQASPEDPVASHYLKQLREQSEKPADTPVRTTPLVQATRQVLAAVVRSAERNQKGLAPNAPNAPNAQGHTGQSERQTDCLTELYFREAAAAAANLPPEHAVSAYLLALGVAIDKSPLMRKNLLTRELWTAIESESERSHRLEVIGTPTMWNRHDLAQHFVVSAALSVVFGPKAAREMGLMKEMADAQGGSGFSFADLSADLAGITFANHLRSSQLTLPDLANSFSILDFVPEPASLREGLTWKDFVRDYGSFSDERFRSEETKVQEKVLSLNGYGASSKR